MKLRELIDFVLQQKKSKGFEKRYIIRCENVYIVRVLGIDDWYTSKDIDNAHHFKNIFSALWLWLNFSYTFRPRNFEIRKIWIPKSTALRFKK